MTPYWVLNCFMVAFLFWTAGKMETRAAIPRAELSPVGEIDRKELAKEIFEFLRKHARKYPEDPSQWEYDGAYELHRCAYHLYRGTPLDKIQVPVSEWHRGGYEPPTAVVQHEAIMWRVWWLLGRTRGLPPPGM